MHKHRFFDPEVWESAPQSIRLEENSVHVWAWDLEISSQEAQFLDSLISTDERLRMIRYRLETDRLRFLAARGTLRQILALYLSIEARDIRFEYGEYGKPALLGEHAPLQFNLSHTKRIAAVALTHNLPIGLDIEDLRSISLETCRHVFSDNEVVEIERLSPERRLIGFFNCWTRKEAVCKAEGKGFHLPTHQFSVPVDSSETLRVEDGDGVLSQEWTLLKLPKISGAVGAIAIPHLPSVIRHFIWSHASLER
jgi:4'-phosphopantetheinyl transferase